MTNGGIIEGRLEISGRSDLSPTTSFGSGATRHANAEPATIRGNCRWCATPLLNLSMKYILLAVIGASVSYGQQFNGTIVDLDSGRIQRFQGQTIDRDQDHRDRMANYDRMIAETYASIDAMRQEGEMQQQTYELRKQTELLRKIANE